MNGVDLFPPGGEAAGGNDYQRLVGNALITDTVDRLFCYAKRRKLVQLRGEAEPNRSIVPAPLRGHASKPMTAASRRVQYGCGMS
jgi:hypothetical protein